MFHQKYFYPSGTQPQNQSQRCRSDGDFAGMSAASAATATPTTGLSWYAPISSVLTEKSSSFMDIRKRFDQLQFAVASSAVPLNSIDERKSAMFVQSTPEIGNSVNVAPNRLSPLHRKTNRATLTSSSPAYPSSDHFHSVLMQSEENHHGGTRNEYTSSKSLAVSDADTATTASSSTSVASPTPSTLSNSSALEEGAENSIEFILDNIEEITNWNKRAGIRESDEKVELKATDRHWEEYKDAIMGGVGLENSQNCNADSECHDFGDTDTEDNDICSCCTPILDNTSRSPQALPHQQSRRAYVRQESSSSMTRTTTTETTTTTTTTTQMTTASSMNTSESVIYQSEVPGGCVPNDSGNNYAAVIPHRQTNHAMTTAPTSVITEQPPCCKSCAAKQRQIKLQRRELRHMKVVMKRLCLLLADSVRSQQAGDGNGTNQLPAPAPGNSVVVSTPATASLSSSSSSSPSVPALHTRRITSLPVVSVGKDYPRISNQRIRLNGQWGTYRGPSYDSTKAEPKNQESESNNETYDSTKAEPKNQESESNNENKNDDDEEEDDETSPYVGILQGCVVRLDKGDMYVGNLSRNDTGSFTFSPPGTLYDDKGKALRRIR